MDLLTDKMLYAELHDDLRTALSHAKMLWYLGDWKQLTKINIEEIRSHPDNQEIAILVASAYLQQCDFKNSDKYLNLAIELGCPYQLITEIFLASIHNILAKVSALVQDDEKLQYHFKKSISVVEETAERDMFSHARSVNELIKLGLIPKALSLADNFYSKKIKGNDSKKHLEAHVKVIGVELEFLRDKVNELNKNNYLRKSKEIIGDIKTEINKDTKNPDNKKYYGHNRLDKKIEAYIDYNNGFFVELGANDGISQSNTLYFEKERGWNGILIEPVLHNYFKCKSNRSKLNSFVCAACVSSDYKKSYVKLSYSNLMTSALDLESDINPIEHAHEGSIHLRDNEEVIEIYTKASTLKEILDNKNAPETIDLLSLDVEGSEIEVLKGIDFSKYKFKYMLIETRTPEIIISFLQHHYYTLIDKLSNHDFLFAFRQTR